MFHALINWMDRDWESRRYNPVFAFAQRLVRLVPVLLSLAVIAVLKCLGFSHDGPVAVSVFALGMAGTFTIMLVSLYRWMAG